LKLLDLVTDEHRDPIDEEVGWVFPGCDWSPDGKRLAVVVRRAGQRELWIVPAEGKSRRAGLEPRRQVDRVLGQSSTAVDP